MRVDICTNLLEYYRSINMDYNINGNVIDWEVSFLDRMLNREQRFKAVNNYVKRKVLQLNKYDEVPYIDGMICDFQIEGSKLNLFFDFKNMDIKEICCHRIVLLILNNFIHSDILYSDICINISEESISFLYCPISYIQNFENQYTNLKTIKLDHGAASISLDCNNFLFNNRVFIKLIKQKEIVDKFYARVMLSEGFEFDNHYIELK